MDELRIAVVFRADLPEMTRGKAEVQFGHAVEGVLLEGGDGLVKGYLDGTLRMKVSLEVDDVAALEAIIARAEKRCVPFHPVVDAGRTCFGKPTFTCVGIGPMTKTECNAITRGARMR